MAILLSWPTFGIGDLDVFMPSPPCLVVYTSYEDGHPESSVTYLWQDRGRAPFITSSSTSRRFRSRPRSIGRRSMRRPATSSASTSSTRGRRRLSNASQKPSRLRSGVRPRKPRPRKRRRQSGAPRPRAESARHSRALPLTARSASRTGEQSGWVNRPASRARRCGAQTVRDRLGVNNDGFDMRMHICYG